MLRLIVPPFGRMDSDSLTEYMYVVLNFLLYVTDFQISSSINIYILVKYSKDIGMMNHRCNCIHLLISLNSASSFFLRESNRKFGTSVMA